MSSSSVIRDETRLFNVAEKYRQLGYKVTVSPPSKELPRFLSKFRPDIIAEGPDESVVVEVTSSGKERGATYWKELSRIVQRHPRWRLELIADASKRRMRQTMNKELARKRLLEGQRLADQGMLAASLLITWSAVEAAMRLAAKQNEIDLLDQRPAVAISRLYTDGVLERQEYDFLVDVFGVRNAVAHGFYQGKIRRTVLKKLHQIGLRLLE
ncbi:MAG: hypothetical protein AABN34_01115 [Acidobacteriota bacterium]